MQGKKPIKYGGTKNNLFATTETPCSMVNTKKMTGTSKRERESDQSLKDR